MKRQLTEDEKKMCRVRSIGIENEMNWCRYQLEYFDLMLAKGLKLNFEKKEREFKIEKKEFEQQLKLGEETLRVIRKQVREGVDIKKIGKENKKEVK